VWGVRGSAPSSPRGGTERLLRSVGSNPARDRMATFPRTRGIFQTLKYHQCVLPFLCEAETSTSGQECQQQTPAFISHHPLLGQQRPRFRSADSSSGLGLLRSREAGPRTAQRPKHQLAAGLSPQDHRYFNNRPLPERERERAIDRKGASFGFLVSCSRTRKPQIRKQWTSVQRPPCAR